MCYSCHFRGQMNLMRYCESRTKQRVYIMMDTKTVALARLRETRESAGLTQEMLADYAGVSCRTVQRIEAGFSASIETAKALAAALELKDINALIKQNADSRQESVSPEASGGSGMSGLGVLYGFCFCVFCCW